MANTHVQIMNMQNVSGTSNIGIKSGNLLNTGDSVYVRVLSNSGKNKYSVSFGGKRFSVTSRKQLEVGSSFKASVVIKDGTVLLVPDFSSSSLVNQSISVQNYLLSLGLPNDVLSKQILQLFVGMGLKFDSRLANRIRLIAAKFVGKEKEAAEAALALLENGISPDVDSVKNLLSILYADTTSMAQYQNKNKSENKKNVHKAEPNDIITKLYGNDTDALFRKAGLLTLFNHSYRNKQHWILFPIKYTIPLNNNQNRIIANGNVRILLDLEKKAVKKTDIFLQFPEKSYMFMLQYNRLEFCTIPNLVQKNYQFDIDLIASLTGFDSKNIIYNNELSEAGFFSEKTIVKFINTEA